MRDVSRVTPEGLSRTGFPLFPTLRRHFGAGALLCTRLLPKRAFRRRAVAPPTPLYEYVTLTVGKIPFMALELATT